MGRTSFQEAVESDFLYARDFVAVSMKELCAKNYDNHVLWCEFCCPGQSGVVITVIYFRFDGYCRRIIVIPPGLRYFTIRGGTQLLLLAYELLLSEIAFIKFGSFIDF